MRIRTVKPEFWSHPVMAKLPHTTQLLALALLSHADDHGYFLADVRIVRGCCQPFRDDLASISRELRELVAVGWIELRESPDHGLIGMVCNWTKHQRVDHPKASKLQEVWGIARTSRELRENFAPEQGTGNREQGAGILSLSLKSPKGSQEGEATLPEKSEAGEANPSPSKPIPDAGQGGQGKSPANGNVAQSRAIPEEPQDDTFQTRLPKPAPKDSGKKIPALHDLWQRLTGQERPIDAQAERLWFDWLRGGWLPSDLSAVITRLRRDIKSGKRNDGALKLCNLLEPSRFADDLALAKAKKPVPEPTSRKQRPTDEEPPRAEITPEAKAIFLQRLAEIRKTKLADKSDAPETP